MSVIDRSAIFRKTATMPAGHSAHTESRRQAALAELHDQRARAARDQSARYELAAVTEQRVAAVLAPLAPGGYTLLPDRAWPGSRRAQVDLVVVGPSGVYIVETKAWAEVSVAGERVFRGQDDVTDDLMNLADLAYKAEAAFAEVGLAPGEVRPVVVLAGRRGIEQRVGPLALVGEGDVLRHIVGRGMRLTPQQVDAVLRIALTYFPPVGAPAPVTAAVPEPVLSADDYSAEPVLLTEAEIQTAVASGVMKAPVEEWMTFLGPRQAGLVRRSYSGPSRIRGAAGTGKTVLGLHRAAYLARSRPGRVLVTSYVRTLPVVLQGLMARLAPDVADKIDFMSVHQLARRILDERGVDVRLSDRAMRAAWGSAWEEVRGGAVFASGRVEAQYWQDEISHVIKARGITSFEAYADLARTGRRMRLTTEQRKAVWELYCLYEAELRKRGVVDFADLILLALEQVESEPWGDYSTVVVDEAQDLSAAAIRLVHGLVGDRPDGLILVADGQQSIYPGGYTLTEVGVSVHGRATVMDVNYRNTRQVLEFAGRMVIGDQVTDLETGALTPSAAGVLRPGDVAGTVLRDGPAPVVARFPTWVARWGAMVGRVRHVTRELGTELGDVAVLCVGKKAAQDAAAALQRAGIATLALTEYDGATRDAVKVGTIKRAKGLEFKQVLMADVRSEWLAAVAEPAAADPTAVSTGVGDAGVERSGPADSQAERLTLLRRELYVAMTRARDGLWVGVV